MTQFQRMVAIPQEEYLQMSAVQNVKQPLTQQFYDLEKQYSGDADASDPYRRLMLQSSTLEQMKALKEKMRYDIGIATPKPYQNRAKVLFNSIEAYLKFNERGEILDKEGNVIPNSRVEDLIQHAVRDRRRNIMPSGWRQFVELLRHHNVPKTVLNRETLNELSESPNRTSDATEKQLPKLRAKRRQTFPKEEIHPRKQPKREYKPTKRMLDFLSTY